MTIERVPAYPKILTYGAPYTGEALDGPVYVQEKVDGSHVKLGVGLDDQLLMESHHSVLFPDSGGQFGIFTQRAQEMYPELLAIKREQGLDAIYVYGEFLAKPKHNTLAYERVPKGHVMMFDLAFVVSGAHNWGSLPFMEGVADRLGIEVVPQLYYGEATFDDILAYMDTPSVLGNERIEGVVIKNYERKIQVGGHIWPLFVKHVAARFKERHGKEWKQTSGKGRLETFLESFCAEGRWAKAVQHLRDEGALTRSPVDIGALVRAVQGDIVEEEAETIRQFLYDLYLPQILRSAVRGLPEWYKQRLIDEIGE